MLYLLDNAHANDLVFFLPSQWFTQCSIPLMAQELIHLLPPFLPFIQLQNTPYPMPCMFPSPACEISRPSSLAPADLIHGRVQYPLPWPFVLILSLPRPSLFPVGTIPSPQPAACEPLYGRPCSFGPRRGRPCSQPRTIPARDQPCRPRTNRPVAGRPHLAPSTAVLVRRPAGRVSTKPPAAGHPLFRSVLQMGVCNVNPCLSNRPDIGPTPVNKNSFLATVSSQKTVVVPKS